MADKIEKARISKNWQWAQAYWNRKSKQLNIVGWIFKMNHTKTRLGMCNYTKKQVCISSYLLRGISCDENKMRSTILHEIAHILAGYENGHNEKWKKISISLGGSPQTCGTMDTISPTYILFCPNGCFTKGYHRKPSTTNRFCKKCNCAPKFYAT
jgi:SprT protein